MARNAPPSPPSQDLSIPEALQRASDHWNAGHAEQAEMLCQRVLAAWPGQPDALHILGLMAHAFGNLDLAIQYLRQACLSPRVPATYLSNLAEMLRQRGELADAEAAGRRATALDPMLVSGWNNLGIILQEAGKLAESMACLERVVQLEPASPQAHNNLGNTCTRLGNLEKARLHYAQALALHPDYAEAESNMAFLLNELGQLDAAAEAARRAIEFNPRLADAYINLAGCEMKRMRPGEALRWLDALLSFAPGHAGGLAAKARILKRTDQMEGALDAAQRAVMASPHSADAQNALGEILAAMNRHDEAFAAFDAAARLPGARADALVNRAILQMELGHKAEALAGFDAVLAAQPDHAPAWVNRVDLKRFAAGDPDIVQMEKLAAAQGTLGFDDRMALHFALGKAYLDAGAPDQAFAHLATGNRMKRGTFTFDVNATARQMEQLSATFTPALFERLAGVGSASSLPIFVLGMPRSGTTLIEQILASHPAVHGAGELSVLDSVVGSLDSYPAALATLAPERFAQLGEAYVARVQPLGYGRRHVVDKMPANFLHAGLIRLMLPQARIIHCRRDPVDTCLSCYTKLFTADQRFAYDLNELGLFHLQYQELMAHWRAVLPAEQFIEVDYEAVVEDLEGEARRLLAALGLPWDARCLAFNETPRQIRTASFAQVRQPIYKSSAGRWKAHAAHLEPLLAALGTPAP
ncbi:sulfotransferase [Xanthobacteraceae bacterium A53D]